MGTEVKRDEHVVAALFGVPPGKPNPKRYAVWARQCPSCRAIEKSRDRWSPTCAAHVSGVGHHSTQTKKSVPSQRSTSGQ